MTETHDRGSPERATRAAAAELGAAWRRFETSLTRHLTAMAERAGEDHLVLELDGPTLPAGATTRYVELSTSLERRVRAEAGGNAGLPADLRLDDAVCAALERRGWSGNDGTNPNWTLVRAAADAAVVAEESVWFLRAGLRVTHPQLLTQQAWGPTSAGVDLLGLCATADVPQEQAAATRMHRAAVDDEPPLPIVTTWTEDLVNLVEAAVLLEVEAPIDFMLYQQRQPVFVRVSEDRNAVRLFARVVFEVASPTEARTDAGIFNRTSDWLEWHVSRRDVWVNGRIECDPFDRSAFSGRLEEFLRALAARRPGLVRRTGGKSY